MTQYVPMGLIEHCETFHTEGIAVWKLINILGLMLTTVGYTCTFPSYHHHSNALSVRTILALARMTLPHQTRRRSRH
jgi:hypothetical protein